jgi:hypothetical protein
MIGREIVSVQSLVALFLTVFSKVPQTKNEANLIDE